MNGNVTQAGLWSYAWDYLNRMLAAGFGNSTTTYAYDPTGARVSQTSTTSTTYYPNRYFSTVSTVVGSTTYATSTNYIWNGDTLAATIDQAMVNGSATGSPITRFIHADHLGSTNAVTDQSGNLVQLMDYYPYGATRISTSVYPTNEQRQYVGQYYDAGSGLSYLNARYYDGNRRQFLSEDPVSLGDPKQQNLYDPQSLNTYSYANDNPITKSDPTGKFAPALVPVVYGLGEFGLGATVEFWGPPVALGVIAGGAFIIASNGWQDVVQGARNYNNNRNGNYRYIPFSQQGRQVQLPGPPDPLDPWDGWKPDGSWKGWIGTGIGIIGAATDIYQQAQDLPSGNQQRGSSGVWTPLPSIVIQNGTTYYRNQSGLLSSNPQPSNTTTTIGNTSVSGGYGSSGSTYTNYIPANAHSACGTLCR